MKKINDKMKKIEDLLTTVKLINQEEMKKESDFFLKEETIRFLSNILNELINNQSYIQEINSIYDYDKNLNKINLELSSIKYGNIIIKTDSKF